MPTATQEWVNDRLFPIEQTSAGLQNDVENMKVKMASSEADLSSTERRFEEVALKVKELEKQIEDMLGKIEAGGPEKEFRRNMSVI